MSDTTDDPLRAALLKRLRDEADHHLRGYPSARRIVMSLLLDAAEALAAAPQPAPAPADERAAMIEVLRGALPSWWKASGKSLFYHQADALLAAGWTRGGDAAGHHALIAQAQALLSINASGNAVPRVPGLAVEIIERLIAALARPSAPETPDGD